MSYELGSVALDIGGGVSLLDNQLLRVQNDLKTLSAECRNSVESNRRQESSYRFTLFFALFGAGLIRASGNVHYNNILSYLDSEVSI